MSRAPAYHPHHAWLATVLALSVLETVASRAQVPTRRILVTPVQRDSVVLTFEQFSTGGPGEGGQVRVDAQYPGVRFNSPWILDYSKGLALPNFAHSGTRAVVLCYGVEFCTDTVFQLRFAQPQARVRVWVGASRPRSSGTAYLRAFDVAGRVIGRAAARIEIGGQRRIQTPLEVRVDSNRIAVAAVSAQGIPAPDFAMDDVEFQRVPAAVPPAVTVSVPYLVGSTLANARQILRASRLSLGRVDTVPARAAAGTVYRQRPDSGVRVRAGDTVSVEVSRGPPSIRVPYLIGRTLDEALRLLADTGLSLGRVSETEASVPAGTVYRQRPDSGVQAQAGDRVSVEVSRGPPPIRVPYLVGRTLDEAQRLLADLGLSLGRVGEAEAPATAGTVYRQRPDSGVRARAGDRVSVEVSRGLPPIRVPYLVGRTLDEARELLTAAGLSLGKVSMAPAPVAPGIVDGQRPDSGVMVPAGESVSVIVSLGPGLIPVPDLSGRTLAHAEELLAAAGLRLGTVVKVRSEGIPGTVHAQYPVAGTRVSPGDTVGVELVIAPRIPRWAIWAVVSAIAVAAGIWWKVRPPKSPRARIGARLASAGLDRQEASVVEEAPIDLELRLTLRLDPLAGAEYVQEEESDLPEERR